MAINTQKVRLVTILRKIELFRDFFSGVCKVVNLGAQFNVFFLLEQIKRIRMIFQVSAEQNLFESF